MFLNKQRGWLVGCALVSVTLLSGCDQQAPGGDRPAPLVEVITVEPTQAIIRADLPGRVAPVRNAEVRARVNGIVQTVLFEQGSEVALDQPLFQIDPAPYQAAFDQARADLRRAQADEKSATALAKRYEPLVKINAISRQEYDNAVGRADQAQASVLAAQAALLRAEIDLGYTSVRSPIAGQIGQALVTEGALVQAAPGTPMALVQQMDPIYVDVFQSVTDLSRLRQDFRAGRLAQVDNESAEVHVLLGDGTVYDGPARLLFTGMSVNETTGQVILRTEVSNPDAVLLPGMFVRVRLEQAVAQDALLVPPQAVQRAPNGLTNLYVVREDKAVLVPVALGNEHENQLIVREGLSPGDEVIVSGFQKIRPGAPVQTRPWQPPQ